LRGLQEAARAIGEFFKIHRRPPLGTKSRPSGT
jgi:hypothetical protein